MRLIGLASGWQAPDGGSVHCDGRPIGDWPRWRLAAKRAVMAQSGSIGVAFTVADVVAIGCDGIGLGLSAADRARLGQEAMERADVAHLAGRIFSTLSGGEQQRTRFARALVQLAAGRTLEATQILILDEPIAGLDLKHQIFLLHTARDLAADGMALLVVLHDLALARAYADDLVLLANGQVAAAGAPDEVLTRQRIAEVFGIDASASRGVLGWLDASPVERADG
eukprot:gene23549-25036_t